MSFSEGHALIIGVGNYQHSPELDVPTTVADAQAVADVLKDEHFCGYPAEQVTLLSGSQASRAGVLTALDHLTRTSPSDTVLIFYSGHGDYAADGTYALTTHDTMWSDRWVDPQTALPQAELIGKIRNIPAQRALLIFNACHAGSISPVLEGVPFLGVPFPSSAANALLSSGSGRIIMTACRENQVSFIGPGPLTIFGQALSDGLRGQGITAKGGYISVYDLYVHVYFTVREKVAQLDESLRKRHGETQEPELTILKGVGPFPVALFRGARALGKFPEHDLPGETAVRRVDPVQSQWAYQQQVQQVASGGGTSNISIQSGRDTNIAGRDVVKIGGDYVGGDKGDKIDARGSQGFIHRPVGGSLQISQQFGDTWSGDFDETEERKRQRP